MKIIAFEVIIDVVYGIVLLLTLFIPQYHWWTWQALFRGKFLGASMLPICFAVVVSLKLTNGRRLQSIMVTR